MADLPGQHRPSTSPGCFRCHDGRHVKQHGEAISSDCGVCHTFLNPVPRQPEMFVEGPYEHSMSLYLHENLRCEQCHTGGSLPTCADCHASGTWLDERGRRLLERWQQAPRRD